LDTTDAPIGTSVLVTANRGSAQRLAFYKTVLNDGVLAPRGWYCLGIQGSSGNALLVSPEPIDGASDQDGPVVSISYSYGEGSGLFIVAEIILRAFPAWRSFADEVYKGFDQTPPAGPYPKDRLKYQSKSMVEYETPAQSEGLGTQSFVKKGDRPINGVAILVGQAPDSVLLSVRLPANLAKLTPEIVRQVERANAK
jgi:hypothetical protein